MTRHKIVLHVNRGSVIAEPNPLSGVQPGDQVVFEVRGAEGQALEVEFHEVRRLCGPRGPFTHQAKGSGRLEGQVPPHPRDTFPDLVSGPELPASEVVEGQRDRFIYDVFAVHRAGKLERRRKLTWARGLEGGGNFGGIDVPKPPPQGG